MISHNRLIPPTALIAALTALLAVPCVEATTWKVPTTNEALWVHSGAEVLGIDLVIRKKERKTP